MENIEIYGLGNLKYMGNMVMYGKYPLGNMQISMENHRV